MLPGLREQDGYEGVVVLANPEGKGMIVTVWDDGGGGERVARPSRSAALERVRDAVPLAARP